MTTTLKALSEKIARDDIFTQAAAFALYIAFSLAPLIVLMIYFLSTLGMNLQSELLFQITQITGSETAEVFETLIYKAQDRSDLSSLAGWLSLIALGISASAIFIQLQLSLNSIFCCKQVETRNMNWGWYLVHYGLKRIASLGMVLGFIAITIISLIVSSAISSAVTHTPEWQTQIVNFLLSFMTFTLLFTCIFKWMPDSKTSFRTSIKGGILTALFFVLGKTLIGLYIGKTAIASAFGAAGSFAVLLVWVYYSAIIIFFGAEVASVLFKDDQNLKYS